MKKLGLVILLILMLSLTGCIKEYQLSEYESNAAAEYMAGILLKKDRNYKAELLELEEIQLQQMSTATTTPTPSPTPIIEDNRKNSGSEGDTAQGKTEENYTITEVIGAKDFDIQYTGYKLGDIYPEDETNAYFSITPGLGNQLLIASFSISNTADKDNKLDLRKSNVKYQLDINVGTINKPSMTLVENDLQFINKTLKKDQKETALLIFEVSKEVDITDINLIISKDSKTEIIEIK